MRLVIMDSRALILASRVCLDSSSDYGRNCCESSSESELVECLSIRYLYGFLAARFGRSFDVPLSLGSRDFSLALGMVV